MTKEDILKLYIADLNNLVADSDAKRSRIIDLEDELEALNQGQSLPIDNVSDSVCKNCDGLEGLNMDHECSECGKRL